MEVELDHNLMTRHEGLYIIGDGSGITHSLSHASASGVYVAETDCLKNVGDYHGKNIYLRKLISRECFAIF